MGLAYKEDWEETKQRFLSWWNHDYSGRCCLAVCTPKKNPPDFPPPPNPARPSKSGSTWTGSAAARSPLEPDLFRRRGDPGLECGLFRSLGHPRHPGLQNGYRYGNRLVVADPGWIRRDRCPTPAPSIPDQENYRFTITAMLHRGVREAGGKSCSPSAPSVAAATPSPRCAARTSSCWTASMPHEARPS